MSQVKKMKEKVKFSKLRLRSTTNKSKMSNSPRPNEKISSYFSSILNETNSNSNENDTQNTESNKNNNLPSAIPTDNEDDFKESKTQKPAKIFEIKCHKEVKNTKKPSRKKKAVPTFGKNITVNQGCSDTNQEHLQLAMAMSKSLDEIENPNRIAVDSVESNNYFPSTQEKMAKIKSTLDQFGFKSNRSITDLPLRQKSVRKKFKYITPTLYLRTDEDRAKIIENKVSEIIENIAVYNMNISINYVKDEIDTEIDSNKPNSFMLRDYYNEEAVLFRKNGISCSEMSQKLFYNGTVAPSTVKAGVLLKDWNSIPGREKTPPLPDTKDNMKSVITENNLRSSPGLNSETLLSENTNDLKSNSPTKIICNKIPSLKIEKPNIYLSSRSASPTLSDKSEFMGLTNNIHQLDVTSQINRSISPDLFSDNDSDTETLFNKKNNSPMIDNESNAPNPYQIISSNDSSSFSCDTVLLSNKTNEFSPLQEICSNGSSNFSIETKILLTKKKPKTISPSFTKKNSICDLEQNISSINSSDFSHETKLLASTKLNENNVTVNVNKAENILKPTEDISGGNSFQFSCETVLLYQNKNYVSPVQDNASNESTFNCETKHLTDQSDDNSVSLLEISPHKNKVKKSPKSPSSCKKNLFESVSLLDFSPHKNKAKKAKKSFNLSRRSTFDDIKPMESTKNTNDLPVSSKNIKKSSSLEISRIDVSAEDNNILHFENFCADSNDCFDLTQSSNDSTDIRFNNKTVGKLMQASNTDLILPETSDILNAMHDKISKNNLNCSVNNDDELMTVSQLINASLIKNNKYNNDNNVIDLSQSSTESTEINNKIDTDKIVTKIELQNNKTQRKKSEETEVQNECLDSIFDKNYRSSSDNGDSPTIETSKKDKTEFLRSISSPSEYCYNKLYNEDINIISFFGHVNRNEISRHKSFEYKSADSSKISHNIKEELDYNLPKSSNRNNSLLDQTMNANKSKTKSIRRSFSEKTIRDKEFIYISPKSSKDNSFLKLISPTENSFQGQSFINYNSSSSVHKIGNINELSSKEIKPKYLNKSFEDLVVSDDELNYSCNEKKFNNSNKSFIRFESEKDHAIFSQSDNSIEISDEELNYSCNKIGNNLSKSASMLLINNLKKQKEDSDDDDVQFLTQTSIDELDEIKNTNRNSVSKLLIATPPNEKEEENADNVQFLSQSSIEPCSDISDEELNYSSNTPYKRKTINQNRNEEKDIENVIDRSLNIEANVIDFNDLPCNEYHHSDSLFGSYNNELNSTPIPVEKTPSINDTRHSDVLKHPRVGDLCTPTSNKVRKSFSQFNNTFDNVVKEYGIFDNIANVNNQENTVEKTPENTKREDEQIIAQNSAIIVKTTNVTPMPKYNDMDTPQRNKELEKIGLKPLKRAKGVKILQYIYDATHPISGAEKIRESSSEDEDNRIIKRRRKSTMDENCETGSSKNSKGKKRKSFNNEIDNVNKKNGIIEIVGDNIATSESLKDMIFERTFSSRIAWCRLPLHIAWHNFVSSQPDLHEKILLYEPLQIEDIYAKFKSYGLKYHIQDLIAFLDRKCITIRIAQTNRKKKTHKSPKGK